MPSQAEGAWLSHNFAFQLAITEAATQLERQIRAAVSWLYRLVECIVGSSSAFVLLGK